MLDCGSRVTLLAAKNSRSVPEVAGAMVDGGGAGRAGELMPAGTAAGPAAAGVTPAWARA